MSRSVRGICLSVAVSLLIAQGALADAYRHAATGITFPDRMATLEKEKQVTDFEEKAPGLGIGVGYNGPGITVTVYLYTMGMKTIPANLKSSILKDHFKQAIGDIVRTGEMGDYSNVKKISEGEVAWGNTGADARSLHASFGYSQSGRDRMSHLYLLGFRNHFLKVRFTYDREMQETAEKVQTEFLREFSSLLGGIGKEAHNQGVQATR